MFAEPQTVTVNAVAKTMPRISMGVSSGKFQKDDGEYSLTVSHRNTKKRNQRMIRMDWNKIAADPLLAGVNVKALAGVWLAIDVPETGFTNAEIKLSIDGFLAYLQASSGAKITQLLGGEN